MPVLDRLESDRLVGRRPQPHDFEHLRRIFQDPAVTATLTVDAQPLPSEEIQQILQRFLQHWQASQFGVWIFEHRLTGEFVGYCGLRHCPVGDADIELLYALIAAAWGQGYATEMAKAALKVGFEQLHFSSVVCFTLPTNRASQNVMAKAGFRYEREGDYKGLPHIFYRLLKADWLKAHSPQLHTGEEA